MYHFNQCPSLPTGHSPFARETGSLPAKPPNLTQKTCSIDIDQLHPSCFFKSDCFSFVNFLDKTGRFMWLLSLIYCESGSGLANSRNRLADILPSKDSDIETILNTVRLRSKRMRWLVATSYYRTAHITAQNGLATLGFQALYTHHTSTLLDTNDSDSDAVLKLPSSNIRYTYISSQLNSYYCISYCTHKYGSTYGNRSW